MYMRHLIMADPSLLVYSLCPLLNFHSLSSYVFCQTERISGDELSLSDFMRLFSQFSTIRGLLLLC